ncbi:MAG: aminoacyl-histidine dipeptidase [Lachnospiraceae bacterium]|nr:aminoacyl-histidine dipeptidase [Candidatus Colinaster scatohippi]
MTEITNLEPKRVFHYFEEISKIPHGSHNTKQISDYLVEFAKSHNLKYRQDNLNNVIIWKDGKGKPVIIQGHMDMVCEKAPDCTKDMEKEGLDLYIDGDYLKARGTTLGGDDGIAVAMALALLEADDPNLPPIEAVITVDEEIGMLGAADIDLSDITGRTMLNIDSENEGIFTVSCAGGTMAYSSVNITREKLTNPGGTYKLSIVGLTGGHSGVEIHKNRANAIELLGKALRLLQDDIGIRLIDIKGGAKDNAIATSASAIFTIDQINHVSCSGICDLCRTNTKEENDTKDILKSMSSGLVDGDVASKIKELKALMTSDEDTLLAETLDIIKNNIAIEYATTDPDIELLCKPIDANSLLFDNNAPTVGLLHPMTLDCTNQIIRLLTCSPNGIQRMSPDVDGLVQTSLNMGVLKSCREVLPGDLIADDKVVLTFCVRSSIESEKTALMRKLRDITLLIGGDITFEGNYPGWKYAVNSPLRDLMVNVYKEQYGTEPEVEAIHAGVECGYFVSKLEGLDCVSFGPNILEIHTFREALDIPSTERTYKLVLETLHRLANI